jgi:hypothetical protein
MKYISKSKFLSGLQCPKLIWTHYNAKDRIPAPDTATQALFDQGHNVGELAKSLFPNGIEIGAGLVREFDEIFERTREGLKKRLPLFEPAFTARNAYARADILVPVGVDEWDIIEVKSTTEVKDVHLYDVAFQNFVFKEAGLRIRNCYLMQINNKYVRQGAIDPTQLFSKVDLTDHADSLYDDVDANLQEMFGIIDADMEPDVGIGIDCNDPYKCPLHDQCWSNVPEHSVFTMYRFGAKAYDLYEKGITDIASIPAEHRLTENQRIQRTSVLSGKDHVDRRSIERFLKTLRYPLYYLDFETINPAVPLFDGTKPYQQIPFQFSLHIQATPNSVLVHHMYLAEGTEDLRQEFMRLLRENLGTSGSIVVYNAGFERGIMKACVETMPEYEQWYVGIEARIVDLLVPFRSFLYYHPAQHGSASIKKVLPVLTDLRYDGEIADGTTASNEYLRVTFGNATEEDRLRVRRNLEEYCGLDTMAMVRIVERLLELTA